MPNRWHHLGYEWNSQDQQDMRLLADQFGIALPLVSA
jgi:hypothetical protein